ncbi:MAG TPA: hypothetical protein VMJ11_12290, partial [Paraburkholderia sp.]|uniref:hypothetical protein n=1 Tax=Paraburkholderia sp. TaxID=1926495 RepID=UPI002B7129D5
ARRRQDQTFQYSTQKVRAIRFASGNPYRTAFVGRFVTPHASHRVSQAYNYDNHIVKINIALRLTFVQSSELTIRV